MFLCPKEAPRTENRCNPVEVEVVGGRVGVSVGWSAPS